MKTRCARHRSITKGRGSPIFPCLSSRLSSALGLLVITSVCQGQVNEITINPANETKTNVNAGAVGAVLCWLTDGEERVRPPTSTAEAINELGCGALRFPYGALADRYLWHSGDYSSATDGLVPKMVFVPSYMRSWPGINSDGTFSKDMDFDEYMALCQTQGRTSLVCINALSHKTSPGQITYEELKTNAVEWVRYAQLRGYEVDYWQIGNEMDHHDDQQTRAEYLALYRDFAAAMKAVDPSIKVGPGILSNANWYQPLVEDSPALTDFVSVHQYMWTWTAGITTYEDWKSTDNHYIPHINRAIDVIDTYASKPTEIHVTETNVTGHDGAGTVNNLYKSLWLAEVLLNQIKAKHVSHTYYWGLHSPWKGTNNESAFEGDDLSVALRMDNNGFKPSAHVISLLNRFALDAFVFAEKNVNQIRTYAMKSAAGDKLNVFLINRNDAAEEVDLSFGSLTSPWAGMRHTYTGTDPYDPSPVITDNRLAVVSGTNLTTVLPPLSLTVLELAEADPHLPLIAIQTPVDGVRVSIGEDVVVTTEVGDPDDNIERVDFMLAGELVASDDAAPYEAVVHNIDSGSHVLEAVVWDTDGNSTSDSVTIESAGSVVFGAGDALWSGGSPTRTLTAEANGLTFALTAHSSGGNLSVGDGGNFLAVNGGDLDGRIDDGATSSPGDDESITFTLSVSGGTLESLSLDSLSLVKVQPDRSRGELQDGAGNSISFNNTGGDANNFGGTPAFDYAEEMAGMTPLSITNVGGIGDNSWELTVVAREGVEGDTVFQVDDIRFSYTLPKPTLLTFGESGVTDWNTWVDSSVGATATQVNATHEVSGVTFSLEMTGNNPLRSFGGGDGSTLVGIGGNQSGRFDEGTTEAPDDDEWITFRLSATGAELERISLDSISLFYNSAEAGIEVVDGSANSVSFVRDEHQTQVYSASALAALTPLSTATVGGQGDHSWELTVYARDGNMQIDELRFKYLVSQSSGDSDGDGASDFWETNNGFNPNDPTDLTLQDSDHDGQIDLLELFQGTNKLDSTSSFTLSPWMDGSQQFTMHYRRSTADHGVQGSMRWSTDLANWHTSGESAGSVTVVLSESIVTTGLGYQVVEVTATATAGSPEKLFLRLQLQPTQ